MENKRFKNIGFDYKDKYYEFGFGMDEVQRLAALSTATKGKFKNTDFFKIALAQNSKAGFISEKTVQEIMDGLVGGVETDDQYLTFEEFIDYLLNLFAQAIDDAAKGVDPAIVEINKDNTVKLTVDGEVYKLMFTREQVIEAFENNVFDFNSIFELYTAGSMIIKASLAHYNKRFSVKLHNHIFLSLWATQFDEDTKNDFSEVINALTYHMSEVVESGVKNSKAAFKVTMK